MKYRVKYGYPRQLVRAGMVPQFNPVWPDASSVTAVCEFLIQQFDSIYTKFYFSYRGYIDIPCEPVASMWGVLSVDDMAEEVITSFKPNQFNQNLLNYDAKVYGSYATKLELFLKVLGGGRSDPPSSSGEHFVRHAGLSGDFIAKSDSFETLEDVWFYWAGIASGQTRHLAGVNTSLRMVSDHPSSFELSTDWSEDLHCLSDILASLHGKSFTWYPPNFGSYLTIVTHDGFDYSLGSEFASFKWHSSLLTTYPAIFGTFSWFSEFRIPYKIPWPTRIIHPGDILYESDRVGVIGQPTYSFRVESVNLIRDPSVSLGRQTGTIYSSPSTPPGFHIPLSAPLSPDYALSQSMRAVPSLIDRSRVLQNFQHYVDVDWLQITPACINSTVDAFKSAESSLDTNVLQDLQHLSGLTEALPNIKEAVHILSSLARRDVSLLTVKQILDLATSTQLQASFEWRPYMDLIFRYLPQMASTFGQLGHTSKLVVGYGSFSHAFQPGTFGRMNSHLTVHTKLVMDTSMRGILSSLLGLDAVGVLPKLSNVLDLVPFTFVLNWFTGVLTSIRRAEYTLLLATIPAYFVHTYTLSSPLTDTELMTWNVMNQSSDSAYLKLYYRDVSLLNPIPKESKFGFGLPSKLPPLATMASLLWQVVFA